MINPKSCYSSREHCKPQNPLNPLEKYLTKKRNQMYELDRQNIPQH